MKGEIICVNAEFTLDQLTFWKKHGVVHPELNKMYYVRDVIIHIDNAGTGVLLEEIINPNVPVETSFGVIEREVSWNLNRFRDLQGFPLKKEEIEVKETNYTEI
jgi:uncharacterized Rmd1/YagE family protein